MKAVNIYIGRLGWKQPKPKITKFINSKVRYEEWGYENYCRFMYHRLDLIIEWTNGGVQ